MLQVADNAKSMVTNMHQLAKKLLNQPFLIIMVRYPPNSPDFYPVTEDTVILLI